MKIAIILASGIGNSLLFHPTLKILRNNFPKAKIDLIVLNPLYAAPFIKSGLINTVKNISNNYLTTFSFLLKNRHHYDISITAFPSNQWKFNLFAYLLGAKKRITHKYEVAHIKTLSFLQNYKLLANPSLHDVEQNLNLLSLLNVKKPKKIPSPKFYISSDDEEFAKKFLKKNKVRSNSYLVGVHAGGDASIGSKKRWGIPNFAKELNAVTAKKKNSVVLIFGGPEETSDKLHLQSLLIKKSIVCNTSLHQTAALIKNCNYFLSNDNGLMHIAASFGIRQKAIFISTNWVRTSPWNEKAIVVKLNKKINFKYPFWSTKP